MADAQAESGPVTAREGLRPMTIGKPGKIATVVAVLAISLAAFWGGVHISEEVFDGVPHVEDEHAFLFQAKVFASGRLVTASPRYPEFFPTQFVIDLEGRRFGKYPPGYPAVLSLGVIAGRPSLVNPLLGAFTLALVFFIGKELYSTLVGLLSAALGLVSPFFLMMSGSFMSHSTSLFFIALFVLSFAKASRTNSIVFPLVAGGSLGMAFITRQLTAIGIAAPFIIYGLVDMRHGRSSLIKYGLMALAFLPFALFLLYFNNVLTGDPFLSPHQIWWPFDKIGFGPEVGGGHTLEAGWLDTQINLLLLSDYLFGWPARLSLVFLVLLFLTLTRKLWDWLLFYAAVSLMSVYVLYWTSGEMYGPRYFYEALPMLLILTARGVVEVNRLVRQVLVKVGAGRFTLDNSHPILPTLLWGEGTRRPWLQSLAAPSGTAIVLAVLVLTGGRSYLVREMGHYKGWYDISAGPLGEVKKAGIHNAVVFVTGESWTEFAAVDVANSPDYDTDVVFAADQEASNRKLTELYPGRRFYRMVEGKISPYTPPW